MKEKNLNEVLEKCSKTELIQVVIKASGMTYAAFPWLKMIGEIRLNELEAKIDANLAESKELTRKFSEMAKNLHNYSNGEVLKVRIAIAKNHEEWECLNRKYEKISKEVYG